MFPDYLNVGFSDKKMSAFPKYLTNANKQPKLNRLHGSVWRSYYYNDDMWITPGSNTAHTRMVFGFRS